MHTAAIRALLARTGWTAAQAGIGALTGPELVNALGLPSAWQPVAMLAIASLLSAAKSFIAAHVGDPATVEFDAAPEGAGH